LAVHLFRKLIVVSLGIPFVFPDPVSISVQILYGILLALGSVTVAALLPAIRISRLDPAVAMRE
jgi:ABC-type lipoprotein release transport system permease subunit